MSRCVCELFGERIQPHLHDAHTRIAAAIREQAVWAAQYITSFTAGRGRTLAARRVPMTEIGGANASPLPLPAAQIETRLSRRRQPVRQPVPREE